MERIYRIVPWHSLSRWERLVERAFHLTRMYYYAPTWIGPVEEREWWNRSDVERGDRP